MKKILVIASMMLLGSSGAWADGTLVGTTVSNSASLSFSVGGVGQTPKTSNTDTFVVDKKINFILATSNTDQVSVYPASIDQETHFDFRNEGNADQNFTFSVSNLATGKTVAAFGTVAPQPKADTIDTNGTIILEYSTDGGTNWTIIGATDKVLISPDTNITLRTRANILASAIDGDIMNLEIVSTAVKADGSTESSTGGQDTKAGIETVVAEGQGPDHADNGDALYDAKYYARSGYEVKTATLDLTKLSCTYSDPITDGGTNSANAKRIPGATITYVFDINNTGSVDASDVNLSDTFVGELDLTSSLGTVKVDKDIGGSCSCNNGADKGGNSGTNVATTNAVSGQILTVKGIEVTHNSHTCVSVRVDIN